MRGKANCLYLRSLASTPQTRRLDDKGVVCPVWQEKEEAFAAQMDTYFDASANDVLESAKDNEGEDSDFKWLEIIRGWHPGVA